MVREAVNERKQETNIFTYLIFFLLDFPFRNNPGSLLSLEGKKKSKKRTTTRSLTHQICRN